MKIKTKILLSVFGTAVAFVGIVMFFLGGQFKEAAYNDAEQIADLYAQNTAIEVQTHLGETMAIVRTISDGVSSTKDVDYFDEDSEFNKTLSSILENNSQFISSGVSWEFSIKNEHKYGRKQGRIRYAYYTESEVDNEIFSKVDLLDTVSYDIRSIYYKIKVAENYEFLVNPYFDKYDPESGKDSIQITTAAVHIREDGQYAGLVAFDIKLDDLQEALKSKIPYKGSYKFLVANNGVVVAHPNKEMIGKKVKKIFDEDFEEDILLKIEAGESFNLGKIKDSGKSDYVTFAPVYAGNTITPWSVGVSIPVEEVAFKFCR